MSLSGALSGARSNPLPSNGRPQQLGQQLGNPGQEFIEEVEAAVLKNTQ